jgi:hypothetical protein
VRCAASCGVPPSPHFPVPVGARLPQPQQVATIRSLKIQASGSNFASCGCGHPRFVPGSGRLDATTTRFAAKERRRRKKLHSEVRRTGIFVDRGQKPNQAPFRSDIMGICRPDGAGIVVWIGATKMPRLRRYGRAGSPLPAVRPSAKTGAHGVTRPTRCHPDRRWQFRPFSPTPICHLPSPNENCS